jgi:hypothetical protein
MAFDALRRRRRLSFRRRQRQRQRHRGIEKPLPHQQLAPSAPKPMLRWMMLRWMSPESARLPSLLHPHLHPAPPP